jgi:hypothetical protein
LIGKFHVEFRRRQLPDQNIVGVVNAMLLFFTPRVLPPRTIFPALFSTSSYEESRKNSYEHPYFKEEKHFVPDRRPPPLQIDLPPLIKPQPTLARDDLPSALTSGKLSRKTIKQAWKHKRSRAPLHKQLTNEAKNSDTSAKHRNTILDEVSTKENRPLSQLSKLSVDKPLPPMPQRLIGLPAHPRTSLNEDNSNQSSSNLAAGVVARRAIGLPVHPAAVARVSQTSFSIEKSYFSATTLSERSPVQQQTLTSSKNGRGRLASAAWSSASPLTGAVFEMVTHPGVYIAGKEGN